jgi:hypothetical protein
MMEGKPQTRKRLATTGWHRQCEDASVSFCSRQAVTRYLAALLINRTGFRHDLDAGLVT